MLFWQDIIRFIRCISRTRISDPEREYIHQFCYKEVPWENVRLIAEMEGVSGLFYKNLEYMELLDRLPESTRILLAKSYQDTSRRNLTYISELNKISTECEKSGISVMALQGISLIPLYVDPGLRSFGDADLMVRPSQKKDFILLLGRLGYSRPSVQFPHIMQKGNVYLDIHTHVLNLDRISSRRYLFPNTIDPMWERAVPLYERLGNLLSPDPYDNLIALSAHALKHGYSRLIWLADIHESFLRIVNDKESYIKIVERARFWKQERILLYAMILMEEIFRVKVPGWFRRELSPGRLNPIERYLISNKVKRYVKRELFILLFLFNIKGFGQKIIFIKETMFPKDEHLIKRVGENIVRIKKIFAWN